MYVFPFDNDWKRCGYYLFPTLGTINGSYSMGHLRPCIKIIRTMRGSMGRCVTFKRVTIMFHIGNYMLISFIVKM